MSENTPTVSEPDVCPTCKVVHQRTPKDHHELLIYWYARLDQARANLQDAQATVRLAEDSVKLIESHGAHTYGGSTKRKFT